MQTIWDPPLLLGNWIHLYVHRLSDLGFDIVAGCEQVSILA